MMEGEVRERRRRAKGCKVRGVRVVLVVGMGKGGLRVMVIRGIKGRLDAEGS